MVDFLDDIDKDYLALVPSNMLNDPTLIQEREGAKRKYAAKIVAIRRRPIKPVFSIVLPLPGGAPLPFP